MKRLLQEYIPVQTSLEPYIVKFTNPYCPMCHVKMEKVRKLRKTYQCPKCRLRKTLNWRRKK